MLGGQRSYVAEVLKAKIPRIDRDVVVGNERRQFVPKLFISHRIYTLSLGET